MLTNLNNFNLNNIVGDDQNSNTLVNIIFNSPLQDNNSSATDALSELLIFERGRDSDVTVQGLNSTGATVGSAITLLRSGTAGTTQQSANLSIDTTLITAAQPVGYWEVDLNSFGVSSISGVQLRNTNRDNGPDYKVVAVNTSRSAQVPAPPSTLGLLVLGFGVQA